MKRACEPELLDSLPHDHPDAVRNRRDLRLINKVMRNGAWFERMLPRLVRPGERVLEVGAGMGEMGVALNARGVAVDGLDLWPRPLAWPDGRAWHQADLRAFAGYGAYPVVIGNLILHQFTQAELAEVGSTLRRTARIVLACEPWRRKISQTIMAAIAPLFGANHVTLHDSRVSIAAGFVGDELPLALGMSPAEWDYSCATTALGALRMVAVRR
jgi:2-polyprenyl-3-methyl-5-hydroxy-6-metoxy-1,4-benzoquinol methylase